MFMLPRWLPHRPQRPAGTVGLIMEFPRGFDAEGHPQRDALRWYCPAVTRPSTRRNGFLRKIDEDLKIIMEQFWQGPVERRTCRTCGTIIERGTAIELAKASGVRPSPETRNPKLETRRKGRKSKVERRRPESRESKTKSKPKKRSWPVGGDEHGIATLRLTRPSLCPCRRSTFTPTSSPSAGPIGPRRADTPAGWSWRMTPRLRGGLRSQCSVRKPTDPARVSATSARICGAPGRDLRKCTSRGLRCRRFPPCP